MQSLTLFQQFLAVVSGLLVGFTLGLVNWLVALEYIGGGILGGLVGARLATRLGKRKKILSRIFAGVIIVVAIYMLYVNLTAIHL